jgi:hypothetical protein
MSHLKPVTKPSASIPGKAIDPAGAVFLQIWAAVMMFILTGAFGK